MPLGVPQIQFETPDGKAEKGKPLERRKTYRWIRGLRECAELAGQLAGVRPVSVMDREAQVELRWREVERVLEWYKLRWRIEDWHRVLKSGCKVEYLGHRQGERSCVKNVLQNFFGICGWGCFRIVLTEVHPPQSLSRCWIATH